ncbi:hypothetical protein Ddc_11300 [Ditylenchus destructor]|nr:hypothetical protein Ddc_11300 [Ditylenchus destructor]
MKNFLSYRIPFPFNFVIIMSYLSILAMNMTTGGTQSPPFGFNFKNDTYTNSIEENGGAGGLGVPLGVQAGLGFPLGLGR